jgi:hypothetical protein
MGRGSPVVEAFTVATVAPALAILAVDSTGWFWPALIISAGHAVCLGAPAFWFLRKRGWLNLCTIVVTGFVIGVVPFGICMWPRPGEGSSAFVSGYGATIVDGVVTAAGWRQYRHFLLVLGGLGGLAGFVFALYLWIRNRLSGSTEPFA